MTIYYLYVKTHNKTGLKYLGQTSKLDPYRYTGSGKDWLIHIKKYGYDVSTEILYESSSKEEINEKGRYYSELWNVAKNDAWANKIPETGSGGYLLGNLNPMKRPEIREKFRGDNHYTKKEGYMETRGGPDHHMKTPKHRLSMTGINNPMSNPIIKQKHFERNREAQQLPETRKKKSEITKARWENQIFKEKTSQKIKDGNTQEVRLKKSLALKGKPQKIITCPHCQKSGGNNMKRFHFDNCKKI